MLSGKLEGADAWDIFHWNMIQGYVLNKLKQEMPRSLDPDTYIARMVAAAVASINKEQDKWESKGDYGNTREQAEAGG